MFLISDNSDTLTGMRLAGIKGVEVKDEDKFKSELEKAISDKNNAIIIITEKLSKEFKTIVDNAKLTNNLPLIVEIPDRHGSSREPDFITKYVREAIGIKI